MKFTLTIQADNATFHGDDCNNNTPCACPELQDEIARILRHIARNSEDHGFSGFFETVYDANGNDVGQFAIKPDSYA